LIGQVFGEKAKSAVVGATPQIDKEIADNRKELEKRVADRRAALEAEQAALNGKVNRQAITQHKEKAKPSVILIAMLYYVSVAALVQIPSIVLKITIHSADHLKNIEKNTERMADGIDEMNRSSPDMGEESEFAGIGG